MEIKQKESPWYGSRHEMNPAMIVCHITEGGYSGAVSWLSNAKRDSQTASSAHFVVSRKGEVTQLVDLANAAWANGTDTDPGSSRFYGLATSKIVRERKTNANRYTVSIEFEGWSKTTKGELAPEQLEAGAELVAHIVQDIKNRFGVEMPVDRSRIIGHCEISPKRKPNCPGPKFPYDTLIKLARKKLGI